MAKESQLTLSNPEQQLLSKEAIHLAPKERLMLLSNARYYPIVKKRTSAEKQIEEMLDLYELFSLMLVHYFPTDKAVDNYVVLSLLESIMSEDSQTIISKSVSEAFDKVKSYEELEKRIVAIRNLFYQYFETFPDLYEKYNLERFAYEKIPDMLENARYALKNNPDWVEEIRNRWGI